MMNRKEEIGFYSIEANVLLVGLKEKGPVMSFPMRAWRRCSPGTNLTTIQGEVQKKTDLETSSENHELKGEK